MPVRSVIAPPQVMQVASPVRRIGPVTTRAGVTRGLCAFSVACTASNSAEPMIGGTATAMCSAFGFSSPVFEQRLLKPHSPT
ncbi:hypothetical protein RSM1_26025 [Methylobacterium radiotolerans]|nr:hypothetical protein RSM1_26025 [Methylobacterium radiotolerans]